MHKIDNILVGLDLTGIDHKAIQFSAYLAHIFNAKKVEFIHVIQAYDLPDKSSKKYPDLDSYIRQLMQDKIDAAISEQSKQFEIRIIIETEEENAAQVIVDYVKSHEVDLTIIGQKIGEDRRSYYGKKIATEARSDVLFVPEEAEIQLNDIFCAIDFSKYSEKAFELAQTIANKKSSKVHVYYLFDTTKAFFPATTLHNTRKKVERSLYKNYKKFLNRFNNENSSVVSDFSFSHSEFNNDAEKLIDKARAENSNLIIVGATGMPQNVTTLLGNISENLRVLEKEIPVWITKNESQYATFMDKLLG